MRGRDYKGTKKVLRVMEMFTVLTVVMVSRCKQAKNVSNHTFKICTDYYVNYTSMKY